MQSISSGSGAPHNLGRLFDQRTLRSRAHRTISGGSGAPSLLTPPRSPRSPSSLFLPLSTVVAVDAVRRPVAAANRAYVDKSQLLHQHAAIERFVVGRAIPFDRALVRYAYHVVPSCGLHKRRPWAARVGWGAQRDEAVWTQKLEPYARVQQRDVQPKAEVNQDTPHDLVRRVNYSGA